MDQSDWIDRLVTGAVTLMAAITGYLTLQRRRIVKVAEKENGNGSTTRALTDMAAQQTQGFMASSQVLRELLDLESRTRAAEKAALEAQIDELQAEVRLLADDNAELRMRLERSESNVRHLSEAIQPMKEKHS